MTSLKELEPLQNDMQQWRRHLHAHPETAFNEYKTADFVAEKLESFGLAVTRGVGRTGVVATLDRGPGKNIGLRADMDGLRMKEDNDFEYRSQHEDTMHACGHDGHMAMLLGAARYLSEHASFTGSVHFIFQPAEENDGGAGVMIADGLFTRFPVDAVFGLHNMPGIPFGTFAIRPGPLMASFAAFDITVSGSGAHAAMPHTGKDTILASTHIIQQLQEVVSRSINALDPSVLSVTKIQGGTTYNIMPNKVELGGTVRTFDSNVEKLIKKRMQEICDGVAHSMGVSVSLKYRGGYPPTVNSEAETEIALAAARKVVGDEKVNGNVPPVMGSEDFSIMLKKRPGAYMIIGMGETGEGKALHQSLYDFNDELLAPGAAWWVSLVEVFMGTG